MKFVFYLFLTVFSDKDTTIYNRESETPLKKIETDINIIKEFHIKYKLLKHLQNDKISYYKKIDLIHSSDLFNDLNHNKLKGPNLCKGLEFM